MRVSVTRLEEARPVEDQPPLERRPRRRRSDARRHLGAWLTRDGPEALRRAADVVAAVSLMAASSPLLLFLMSDRSGASILETTARAGRWHQSFRAYSFRLPRGRAGRLLARIHAERLGILINVLKGDVSLVGPRSVAPRDLHPRDPRYRARYKVRPGLVCLHWLRRRATIDYGPEWEADAEYVQTRNLWTDVGILVRALPALLYGLPRPAGKHITILGIPIDNLRMAEALDAITAYVEGSSPTQVSFVNAHCANVAADDYEYLQALRQSSLVLADGIGMRLAGRVLHRELRQNINGTDLFPRLCDRLSDSRRTVFLLGGRPGVPERVREWMERRYPAVRVSGVSHGFFDPRDSVVVAKQIADSGAELLLVGLGVPQQEKWIREHLERCGVKVALGVGGLFDFYSGRIPRAPQWMREVGLEWLFRLVQEPRRMWRRYLVGNGRFLARVLGERLGMASARPRPTSE